MGHLCSCHRGADYMTNRRFSIHSNNGAKIDLTAAAASAEPAAGSKPMPALKDDDVADSYAEKAKIDSEELVLRYLHLIQDEGGRRLGRHHDSCRVSFRAESFDSQSSTKSERRQFVFDLVDNLPETFVDDALPPASVRGPLVSWNSEPDVQLDDEDAEKEKDSSRLNDAVFFTDCDNADRQGLTPPNLGESLTRQKQEILA